MTFGQIENDLLGMNQHTYQTDIWMVAYQFTKELQYADQFSYSWILIHQAGWLLGNDWIVGWSRSIEQGRIHGNPVADGWAGAVMQKYPRNSKMWQMDGPTDGPTDLPTDLPTNTARCRAACPRLKISGFRGVKTWHDYPMPSLKEQKKILEWLKNEVLPSVASEMKWSLIFLLFCI